MKKFLILKIFVLIAISILLVNYPLKFCIDTLIEFSQYKQLCYTMGFDIGGTNKSEQVAVFYGNNAPKNAENYIKRISSIEGVESTHIFDTNTNLITQIFIGINNLEYETKCELIGTNAEGEPVNYRRLKVKNADGYEVTNNGSLWMKEHLNIGSYEIPDMFIKYDYLKLKEGRYPSKSEYIQRDYVEIVVTDGLGLKINDECFISLDALDENKNLVVLKAKVVGISSKGIFLPYYERYFSAQSSDVSEAYNRVFNGEMIYYTDLSSFYKYNSHFTNQEKEAIDTTTVTLLLIDKEKSAITSDLLDEYDGKNIASATGLISSPVNLFGFRYFSGYNDLAFGQNISTAETNLLFSIFLLSYILIYIISVVIKVVSLVRNYKTQNSTQGDQE